MLDTLPADVIKIALGLIGAVAGGLSASWWLAAARVPPVYNTAMLGGNREEAGRTDLMASLNARGARAAAAAVSCQAIILAIDALGFSN
jgi:hypothetical protein